MNNELKINGTQKFMGIDIPVIEGGFGENQKVILAKTVAEIHNQPLKKINQLINDNIDEFEFGVDILDLKSGYLESTEFLEDIMSKQSIANSSYIYLLSEQGYMLLVGFMKTEKSKDIRKNLRREYFSMRQELNEIKQKKATLLLKIYDGGQNAILASKQLTEIEVKEATSPLIAENNVMKPKAEYHDEVLKKDGLITTTVVAKDLGFSSANKLNKVMNANHIIFKNQSSTWCPYAEYEWLIEDNYADYESYTNEHSKPCLKWTEKGRKWIVENYNQWVMNLAS